MVEKWGFQLPYTALWEMYFLCIFLQFSLESNIE